MATENHKQEADVIVRMIAKGTARALAVTGMLVAGLTLAGVATATAAPTNETVTPTEATQSHRMSAAEVSAALADGELAAKPALAAMRSTAGGCWSARAYDTWSNFDVPEGNTWFTLNWCSDGTKVTTSDYRNVGAQGLNTFQFTGIAGDWDNNVGWETRTALEYRFSFEGKNFFVCEQLRGGATGLYSHRQDCNLG